MNLRFGTYQCEVHLVQYLKLKETNLVVEVHASENQPLAFGEIGSNEDLPSQIVFIAREDFFRFLNRPNLFNELIFVVDHLSCTTHIFVVTYMRSRNIVDRLPLEEHLKWLNTLIGKRGE